MLTLYNLDRLHPNFPDCQPSSLKTNKKPSNEENYYKIQRDVICFAEKTDEQKKRKNKRTNKQKTRKKDKTKLKQRKSNLKQNKQTLLYISGNCSLT